MSAAVDVHTPNHHSQNLISLGLADDSQLDQPSTRRAFEDVGAVTTSAKESFSGLSAQRPLPTAPMTPSSDTLIRPAGRKGPIDRISSQRSARSTDSQDITMADDDDEEGQDISDNESAAGDGERPSKKKKGQRFFCTDFPPCQLSFTRSEHLARHIRKHTGERPFQCHCFRRFSRLDNLRQHAQTVHVNEEIPGDSLAATGTRFQRQIRTERVRTPTNRARASTTGSQGSFTPGHSRGHSGSSLGSTEMASPDDGRRNPPPLAIAPNPSSARGLTLDTANANTYYQQYYNASPTGYTTPVSILPADGSSPQANSGLQSPISMISAAPVMGAQVPGRRLSVPSGRIPFHASTAYNQSSVAFMSPLASSTNSTFSGSGSGSLLTSPTSSVFSTGRKESALAAAEAEWRRRTWHPGTFSSTSRPATSGLSYYQTPDTPRPVSAARPAAEQGLRLPGIDSFDRTYPASIVLPRRRPSPMEIDAAVHQPTMTDPSARPVTAHPSIQRNSWDMMNQNLTRLDIAQATPAQDRYVWRNSTNTQQAVIDPQLQSATFVPTAASLNRSAVPPPLAQTFRTLPPNQQKEEPTTPRRKKRQAWYNGPLPESAGPLPAHRTSPEGSSSSDGLLTPSTSVPEFHPAIVHSNGYIEFIAAGASVEDAAKAQEIARQAAIAYPLQHHFAMPPPPPQLTSGIPTSTVRSGGGDMERLEALVAVATSENRSGGQ